MQNTLCVFFLKCFLFDPHLQEDSPEKERQRNKRDITLCVTKSTTGIWLYVTENLINWRSAMQSYVDLNNFLVNQFSNHCNWYKSSDTNTILKSAFFLLLRKFEVFPPLKSNFSQGILRWCIPSERKPQISSDKCNSTQVH